MSRFKIIKDSMRIADLFKNLARKKSVPVIVTLRKKLYFGNMQFTVKKGSDPSIAVSEGALEIQAGDKLSISFTDRELAVFFKTTAVSSSIENIFDIQKPLCVYASFKRLVPRYTFSEREEAAISYDNGVLAGRILDISVSGLSFISGGRLLDKGMELNNAL